MTDLVPYAAIIQQAPDAVIYIDREGVIRVWNRGAESVFGYTADEAVGQSVDLIVPERFRPAHWAGFRRAVETGHTRPGDPVRTTRSTHKDGRKLYIEISFGLVTGEDGSVVGSVAVGRDCTARYLANRPAAAAA
jgi:PAS domain S-box-containing protein